MPVTIKFDPNTSQIQAAVIQDATPRNDGVMTKAQAALLAGVGPGVGQFGTGTVLWLQGVQTFAEVMATIGGIKARHGEALVFMSDGGSGTPFVFDQPADLDNVRFVGVTRGSQPNVIFAPGFVLLGTQLYVDSLQILTQTTIWTWNALAPKVIDWVIRAGVFLDDGAPPLAVLGGTSLHNVAIEQSGYVTGLQELVPPFDVTVPAFTLPDGGMLFAACSDQAYIDNTFVGFAVGATTATFYVSVDATVRADRTLDLPPGLFDPASNFLYVGEASSLFYSPNLVNAFANPPPVDVQAAIDRIASLVKTLNGGTPIP